jgi:hypothetical protein
MNDRVGNPRMTFDLARMIEQLHILHDSIGQLIESQGTQPVRDSKAYIELHSYVRPESVITAYSQGSILFEVSADQLMAFAKTITEPAQAIAPWTCVRAIIEASALASWLLASSIDAATRVMRSLAFRYEGLSQQEKYLRSLHDELNQKKVVALIDKVEQHAIELGFSKVVDKNGRRRGIGQIMPPITDIVCETIKEEESYRILSAMTHAHPWALLILSFRRVASENTVFTGGGDQDVVVRALEKNLKLESVISLCHKAIICFAKPVWDKFQLFGWDQNHLQELLENTFNVFQVNEDRRFWRQNTTRSSFIAV